MNSHQANNFGALRFSLALQQKTCFSNFLLPQSVLLGNFVQCLDARVCTGMAFLCVSVERCEFTAKAERNGLKWKTAASVIRDLN